jgi:hypothetical protein
MPIKVLLTFALSGVMAYALVQRTVPSIVKSVTIVFVAAGMYFVWLPQHTTMVANWLGVGRGTDLLIYVWIILSFAVGLNLNFKVRAARREITEVTRALALATAREPGPPRAVRDSAVVDRGADDEDEVAPEHRQSPERGGAA